MIAEVKSEAITNEEMDHAIKTLTEALQANKVRKIVGVAAMHVLIDSVKEQEGLEVIKVNAKENKENML